MIKVSDTGEAIRHKSCREGSREDSEGVTARGTGCFPSSWETSVGQNSRMVCSLGLPPHTPAQSGQGGWDKSRRDSQTRGDHRSGVALRAHLIQQSQNALRPRREGTCPGVRWVRSSPRTRGPKASLHVVKGADVRLPRPLPRAGSPPPHTMSALFHPRLAARMCTFPGSTITKDHKLSGLNSRNVLSHLSGGWKSEIEMSAEPVPSEGCEGRICPRSLSFTLSVKKA